MTNFRAKLKPQQAHTLFGMIEFAETVSNLGNQRLAAARYSDPETVTRTATSDVKEEK
jgi:hypothetical protein